MKWHHSKFTLSLSEQDTHTSAVKEPSISISLFWKPKEGIMKRFAFVSMAMLTLVCLISVVPAYARHGHH